MLVQPLPGNLAIVEPTPLAADNLIILMPLACDHNHIALAREPQRDRNRAAPIRFDEVADRIVRARFDDTRKAGARESRFDIHDDLQRVFGARIVGS